MKKFIFIVVALVCLSGCGISRMASTNDVDTVEAYGFSFDKDMAYKIAFDNAVMKTAGKHESDVNVNSSTSYSSTLNDRGNVETKDNAINYTNHSKAVISNPSKETVTYKGDSRNGWECHIVLVIPKQNIR